MAPPQAGCIVKNLIVRVGISAVKQAVGNGQGRIVRNPVASWLKGGHIAQFAHPVVGSRCGGQACCLCTAENGGRGAEPGIIIMHNAALRRAQTCEQCGVNGAGERRQFALQLRMARQPRIGERLHVTHAAAGRGGGKAIQQHKDHAGHYQSPLPAGRGPKSRPGACSRSWAAVSPRTA